MLVRIVEKRPGCVWQPGQLLKLSDKAGRSWIKRGLAVEVVEQYSPADPVNPPPPPPEQPIKAYMQPPRFICACGFVAKNKKSLVEHRAQCE